MNEPTGTNGSSKGSGIALASVIVTALATVGILFVYWSQLRVMGDQLDVMETTLQSMEESQRFAKRPMVKLHLHMDPFKASTSGYKGTEECGERWELYYYALNMGGNPAYDLHYWHGLSTDSVIDLPDTSEFQSRFADEMLFPNEYFQCGFDQLLRQVWIDRDSDGIATYRHFVVTYRDLDNNRYMFHAVWRILYQKDQPLNYIQVSYESIEAE